MRSGATQAGVAATKWKDYADTTMINRPFSILFLLLPLLAYAEAWSAALADPADNPIWSYDNDVTGQEDWGTLSHDFAACEIGTQQSPINISDTKRSMRPPIEITYTPSKAKIRIADRALSIEPEGKNILVDHGKEYRLQSIRFRTPGEHLIRSKFHVAEIQMMHKAADGSLLILSVLVNKGKEVASLNEALDKNVTQVQIDPFNLLPLSHAYYAYTGSLTHPPCTEGVEWRILTVPITLSKEQLKAISSRTGRNARLTQPVYMRVVDETGK